MSSNPADTAARLHAMARAGDRNARAALVDDNLGLVRTVARSFRGRIDPADAFQEGVIGLMVAIDTWDPAGHPGARWGAYAARGIREHVRRAIVPGAEAQGRERVDARPGPGAESDAGERSRLIRGAWAALSPAQAEVISALEGLDGRPESIDHLARRLRCAPAVVMQVRAAAIAALRAALRPDVAP